MEKKWIELKERKETWGNMLDRVVSDSVSLGKMVQIEGICADFHRKETADPCNLLPTSISTQMASHITAQTSYLCAGVNSLTQVLIILPLTYFQVSNSLHPTDTF